MTLAHFTAHELPATVAIFASGWLLGAAPSFGRRLAGWRRRAR